MPKLRWRFVLPALVSVYLGARELYLAWTVLFYSVELTPYVQPTALTLIQSEFIFLVVSGSFLIGWPIAYRVRVIRFHHRGR